MTNFTSPFAADMGQGSFGGPMPSFAMPGGLPPMGPPTPPFGPQGPNTLQPMQPMPTTPYKPSTAANVINGIGMFMQNYKAAQEHSKKAAWDEASRGIQAMMLGLPADYDKIAKSLHKSGLVPKSALEGPTPQQLAAAAQQVQSQSTDAAMQGPLTGPMAGAGALGTPGAQQNPNVMTGPTPTQQQLQGPGLLQRAGQAMGLTQPNVDPRSQVSQWLQGMAQQGLQARQTTQQLETVRRGMISNLHTAMTGDQNDPKTQQAIENSIRLGTMKALDRYDEAYRMVGTATGFKPGWREEAAKKILWMESGGPAMAQHMMKMSQDLAPRFGNDLQKASQYVMATMNGEKPAQQPDMTMEEKMKLNQQAIDITKLHPGMPLSIGQAWSLANATGNQAAAKDIMEVISKHPTEGTVKAAEWLSGHQQTYEMHKQTLASHYQMHKESLALQSLNAATQQYGEEWKRGWEMYSKKDASAEDAAMGFKLMGDAASRVGEVRYNVGGRELRAGPQIILKRAKAIVGEGGKGSWLLDIPGLAMDIPSAPGEAAKHTTGDTAKIWDKLQKINKDDLSKDEYQQMQRQLAISTGNMLSFGTGLLRQEFMREWNNPPQPPQQ